MRDKTIQDINWDELTFSLNPTRSMFIAHCDQNGEWDSGSMQPFGDVSMSPAAGVLNYGQGIFEGLKAYRTVKDRVILFRPERNAKRAVSSAERVCIPPVPEKKFLDAVVQVVQDNLDYVPPREKGSLYIRPVIWGTGPVLGVAPVPSYTFLIYVTPVGPYFKTGIRCLSLKITSDYHRAAPKGTGGDKVIGNYAASLYPQRLAKQAGFDEAIFLNAESEDYIEEVGSANLFAVKDGVLRTPGLDGSILPGVTRDSVLTLAREMMKMEVREGNLSVEEFMSAEEVFISGTAVVVTPVGSLSTDTSTATINNNQIGPVVKKLNELLLGIQHELIKDRFDWIYPVESK